MSLHHFTTPRLRHSLLFTPLLLTNSFSAHAADEVLRKVVGKGTYEMAYSQQENVLWVATSQNHSPDKGGTVYHLDPTTLDVMQITHNDLKPFGTTINHTTSTLWFSDIVGSTVAAIDVKTGAVKGRLVLDKRQRSKTVRPLQPHELMVGEQTNTVCITGLGEEGVIWVVDGATLKLKTTVTGTGAMATGLAIDPQAKRFYTANANGELLTIGSESNTTVSRKKLQNDGKAHFYLNLNLDTAGHRASTTDSKQPEVPVVDTRDGKVLERITTPESLTVLFSLTRNETYVTHRKAGEISVIDDKRYKVVKTSKTPTHPNSLVLSDGGKTLYINMKQAPSREKEATTPDDAIRIAL